MQKNHKYIPCLLKLS